MKNALRGLRILDLSMNLPGPYMTWLLVEMGAEVLKIEPPKGGDLARAFMNKGQQNYFPVFDMVNRGKKSLLLDLKNPKGRATFLALLGDYDIVIEGFRPGVMKSLKLDYDSVSPKYSNIIYVSITGYGQAGSYAHRAGHDLNFQALAGSFDTGGAISQDLRVPPLPVADLAGGGLLSLSALLAAIIERSRTGKGQQVDISMFDGVFALNVLSLCHLQTMSANPQTASVGHFLSGSQPFYQIYETRDGRWMSLAAVEPKFWKNFCKAVGREDFFELQFGGHAIIEKVSAIFKSRTQAEWVQVFNKTDACCEPVLTLTETIGSNLCQERALLTSDDEGRPFLTSPFSSPDKQQSEMLLTPQLGQHSEEVLSILQGV
jgi:crotonobetainyl-CoA:carnitine CoA-transferase CaiB-like acyl-CoA transferase